MSEPSSLYLRVHLSEAAWQAYMQSVPSSPATYSDWQDWLETKRTYERFDATLFETIPAQSITCREYIDRWIGDPAAYPALSRYDTLTQTWILIIGETAEHYFDFVDLITVFRGIALFKDLPHDDFVLIWSYFWSGEENAYIVIKQKTSKFEAEIPAALMTEVASAMTTLVKSGEKRSLRL